MPTYDYRCPGCEKAWEQHQLMSDPPLQECPDCQAKPRRLIGRGGALVFKGTGFYCTDYKRPDKKRKAVYEG